MTPADDDTNSTLLVGSPGATNLDSAPEEVNSSAVRRIHFEWSPLFGGASRDLPVEAGPRLFAPANYVEAPHPEAHLGGITTARVTLEYERDRTIQHREYELIGMTMLHDLEAPHIYHWVSQTGREIIGDHGSPLFS